MASDDTRHTLIGRKLGRFEIVRELGRGAMGIVYEARDPVIGRRVAIKTVKADVAEGVSSEVLERFHREASAAGTLSHQNIVTIYDVGEQEGVVYIAMEFLEGQPLDRILAERRSLPVQECVDIAAKVLDGLSHAHQHGIVHRDVKPANIVVNDDGAVKVADFGVAHTFDSNLTRTGVLIGTPHYMSPEQFAAGNIDGRSDIFSVAAILYEMLAGEKAFHGETLGTMMHNVMNTQPVPVRKLNLHVPEPLAAVIEQALAKDPLSRYQDAAAFAAALRESVKPSHDLSRLQLAGSDGKPATGTAASTSETVVAPGSPVSVQQTVMAQRPAASSLRRMARIRMPAAIVACAAIVVAISLGYTYFRSSPDTEGGTSETDQPVIEPAILRLATLEMDLDTTEPRDLAGVAVYIRGGEYGDTREMLGETPLLGKKVNIEGGDYILELEKPGYETQPLTVTDFQPGMFREVGPVLMARKEESANSNQ